MAVAAMHHRYRRSYLQQCNILLDCFAFFTVPNQTPAIVETYLTSATSLRVSWTAVKEPIAGYQVAFRSTSAGEWTSVYATSQTFSMHLENLKKGDVYRLRIAAFNAAGNGVPSDGAEIHMKEGGNVVNGLFLQCI